MSEKRRLRREKSRRGNQKIALPIGKNATDMWLNPLLMTRLIMDHFGDMRIAKLFWQHLNPRADFPPYALLITIDNLGKSKVIFKRRGFIEDREEWNDKEVLSEIKEKLPGIIEREHPLFFMTSYEWPSRPDENYEKVKEFSINWIYFSKLYDVREFMSNMSKEPQEWMLKLKDSDYVAVDVVHIEFFATVLLELVRLSDLADLDEKEFCQSFRGWIDETIERHMPEKSSLDFGVTPEELVLTKEQLFQLARELYQRETR